MQIQYLKEAYVSVFLIINRILRIKKIDGRCFFLTDGKCEIYFIRPKICRIYPYWCVKLINGRVKIIAHDFPCSCDICNVDSLSKDADKENDAFMKAFILYQSGKFEKALTAFKNLKKDSVVTLYIERCSVLLKDSIDSWDGVWTMDTK
jgi:Fe-S-cluster containining protein